MSFLLLFFLAIASPNLQQGIKLYEEGKVREAIEPLRRELKANPTSFTAQAYLGLSFAEAGFCPDGEPLLKKSLPNISDKEMRRAMAESGIKCAMSSNQQDDALAFLHALRRDYPKDPEVLYLATHVFSDLSLRTSQELIFSAPSSYQVHQLNAEALETQGKWDEAASEYRVVLEQNPKLANIHFRIARLILSKPKTASTFPEATKELNEELRLNPNNPGAEYTLGEIARESDDWQAAIDHFSKAALLDSNFADAFIGLGRSLIQVDKSTEAIQPLRVAVQLQPANPTPHYHLAVAYRRSGQISAADRESQLFKQASDQAAANRRSVENGLLGQGIDPKEKP
jgi:tetratricopeptide (TPR) repeat protein